MDNLPKITVIIPIRNEAAFIAQTVKYLQEQDYPADRMEILVVDGFSEDGSRDIVSAIAAEDSRVRLLDNPVRLSSGARNIGAREATGEIVLYVDGHTYIDNDQLLKNTARLLQDKQVSVLSRPQYLDTPENTTFQKAVALARRSQLGHGLDSTIYTDKEMYVNPASSGAAYRREVFDRVGYFDERFDASEDYEFNCRLHKYGYESFTSLKLAVYYYPRKTFGALFKQMSRYGTGRFRLFRKYPETLGIGTLVPPLFLLGLLGLPLLSLLWPLFLYLFIAGYGLYALTALFSSLLIALKNGPVYLLLCPPIYLTVHLGLGYGFIAEGIRTMLGKAPEIKRAQPVEASHDK